MYTYLSTYLPTLQAPVTGNAVRPPKGLSLAVIGGLTMLLCLFGYHATYVSSIAYSSPSIVIDAGRMPDGRRIMYDDITVKLTFGYDR